MARPARRASGLAMASWRNVPDDLSASWTRRAWRAAARLAACSLALRSDPAAAVGSGVRRYSKPAWRSGRGCSTRCWPTSTAEQRLLADGALPAASGVRQPGVPAALPDRRGRPSQLCSSMPPTWCAGRTATGMCWPTAPSSPTVWRMRCRTAGSSGACHAGAVRLTATAPHRSVRRALPGHAAARSPPTRRPGVALLTPGHADPAWFEHVLLARELSCALVEGGDLTVRDGGLFLKTLRGLQRIGVLLRGIDGRLVDPLELEPDGVGAPGLLAAARDHVRIVNSPGSGLAEAPALAAFLPDLAPTAARRGPCAAQRADGLAGRRRRLRDAYCRICTNGASARRWRRHLPPVPLATWPSRTAAPCSIGWRPRPGVSRRARWCTPSVAPCLATDGLVPRPRAVRMFLVRDRSGWRAMPGGLGCVLADERANRGRVQDRCVAKDVWVLRGGSGCDRGPRR